MLYQKPVIALYNVFIARFKVSYEFISLLCLF